MITLLASLLIPVLKKWLLFWIDILQKSGIGKFIKGSVRGTIRKCYIATTSVWLHLALSPMGFFLLATGPRLDGSKSLAEQFDFSIKPYVLNLE